MANNVGDCMGYLSESLTASCTALPPIDHAFLRCRCAPQRGQQSPSLLLLKNRLRAVLAPSTMTNALQEVLTRGQNRPRNGGSSSEKLATRIVLGRAMLDRGNVPGYCGFNLTISLMLRTGYNLFRCVRGDNPVSLGFVDSVRTIQLES